MRVCEWCKYPLERLQCNHLLCEFAYTQGYCSYPHFQADTRYQQLRKKAS